MDKNIIIEIKKEYNRIDKKWLRLHFKASLGLVLFSIFVECVIGVLVCNSDELNATIPIYLLKFLIIPSVLNMICIFIGYRVLKMKKITQKAKIYNISLLFVVICFILFTVHIFFSAVYFVFVVAILLTIIYADYKLTILTSSLSISLAVISELFIKWDIDKVSIFSNTNRMGVFIISIFILIAFTGVSLMVVFFEKEKNIASIQKEMERYELVQKLKVDDLTGIYNRNAFRDEINKMIRDDSGNKYVFAMIDIDNFKSINDTLGHIIGDHCLVGFSEVLVENCEDAVPFRFGGDEFCILFKNLSMETILDTCEQIQKDFSKLDVVGESGIPLTVSFGIARYSKGMSASKLIFNTDKALYEAKIEKDTIRIYNA